jgi:phosphate starvation-inducible PhoH-like protein
VEPQIVAGLAPNHGFDHLIDARGVSLGVTGDPSQIDLPRAEQSGLAHAVALLENLPGVDVIRFGAQDVVRHRLVAHIIEAYHRDEAGRA